MNYNEQYNKYLELFNAELTKAFNKVDNTPNILKESMYYAVEGGGKRVRPVLCYAVADLLNVDFVKIKKYAVALELIHSYSLVHDDLPAMDNDDFRRGKLSTHKKFGEAYGILAGDALLNYAFEYCLNKKNQTLLDLKALKILAECSGYTGMIAGQVYDMQYEKKQTATEIDLYDIYKKTYKLLTAPLLIPSVLSGGKYYKELEEYGFHLGVTFQITDDIMDVEGELNSIGKTPHKDQSVDKLTSIKIWGLDGAKDRAKYHYDCCINILNKIDGSEFLSEFTKAMFKRKK